MDRDTGDMYLVHIFSNKVEYCLLGGKIWTVSNEYFKANTCSSCEYIGEL